MPLQIAEADTNCSATFSGGAVAELPRARGGPKTLTGLRGFGEDSGDSQGVAVTECEWTRAPRPPRRRPGPGPPDLSRRSIVCNVHGDEAAIDSPPPGVAPGAAVWCEGGRQRSRDGGDAPTCCRRAPVDTGR